MAQSFSDYSMGSESDSSKEETIYDTIRATAVKPHSATTEEGQGSSLVIRILIQDLQQTKCIRFDPDATVWAAKQRVLCSLTQSLKDVLNYGLFQPASNGRVGKFLDEERLLREYPQPAGTGVPSLEFRYKKRVYKQSNLDEKQLAKLHTKTNLKKCMDYIQHRSVEKIVKMLDRGLDPNFHDLDTGETPLTLAAQLDDAMEVIKALKNGGAHLDFRARDGMTALHKAARARNQVALKRAVRAMPALGVSSRPCWSSAPPRITRTAAASRRCTTRRSWGATPPAASCSCMSTRPSAARMTMAGRRSTRPAGTDTCSTWSTCSSTGPTWGPRTPRGTRPCTSAPSTTRTAAPACCCFGAGTRS